MITCSCVYVISATLMTHHHSYHCQPQDVMNTYPITLRDADEIEQFFLETTGMKPGYIQLSRGLADLRMRVVELAGVTLVWTRARARARWRDQMTGAGLHIGFAIESKGPISVRGHDIEPDEAQVWMPDREMDLILGGPNLTLDLGVDASIVDERGWQFEGDPLRRVPAKALTRLIQDCDRATETVRGLQAKQQAADVEIEILRDNILIDLEPVLQPWLPAGTASEPAMFTEVSHYQLVRKADAYFDSVGIEAPFEVNDLANWLGVPRRTVFHSFNKLLGVGPRRYLEIKRLHALRARLRQTAYTNSTVASVATELGFSDLGRLATIYQHQFGEKPSETLKYG